MNNFEYLQYVSLGQYVPTGSWIHRLDPRARILGAFFLLAALTAARHPLGLLVGLVIVFLLVVASRIPLSFILKSLLPPLPFLLILAILQVLFFTAPGSSDVLFQAWIVKISPASLLSGGMLLLRFAGLVLLIALASMVLSTSEGILGLESLLSPFKRIGIPTEDLVMTVQVMLRFLPFLALSAERIAKAQASRGAIWGTRGSGLLNRVRQVIPLLVPLFVTTLRKSENLALAMEARGYRSQAKRSHMMEMHVRPVDFLAVAASIGLATLIIWL